MGAGEEPEPVSERRQHRRANLHCTLYMTESAAAQTIRCKTENISSGGFYGISDEPFTNGEWLRCTILFPVTGDETNTFALECTVEVLRVDLIGSRPAFGLACRIHDYAVVSHSRYADTIQ